MIQVWPFEHAPEKWKALSKHGGDEDWVAEIPIALADAWIGLAESNTPFGCCDVSEHKLPDGRKILIGAHA